jgi:hypothetical protein
MMLTVGAYTAKIAVSSACGDEASYSKQGNRKRHMRRVEGCANDAQRAIIMRHCGEHKHKKRNTWKINKDYVKTQTSPRLHVLPSITLWVFFFFCSFHFCSVCFLQRELRSDNSPYRQNDASEGPKKLDDECIRTLLRISERLVMLGSPNKNLIRQKNTTTYEV